MSSHSSRDVVDLGKPWWRRISGKVDWTMVIALAALWLSASTIINDAYAAHPILHVESPTASLHPADGRTLIFTFSVVNAGQHSAEEIVMTALVYHESYLSSKDPSRLDIVPGSGAGILGPGSDTAPQFEIQFPTADHEPLDIIFALRFQDVDSGEPGGFVEYYAFEGLNNNTFREELRSQPLEKSRLAADVFEEKLVEYEEASEGWRGISRWYCYFVMIGCH